MRKLFSLVTTHVNNVTYIPAFIKNFFIGFEFRNTRISINVSYFVCFCRCLLSLPRLGELLPTTLEVCIGGPRDNRRNLTYLRIANVRSAMLPHFHTRMTKSFCHE